jgi:hypothetical protein
MADQTHRSSPHLGDESTVAIDRELRELGREVARSRGEVDAIESRHLQELREPRRRARAPKDQLAARIATQLGVSPYDVVIARGGGCPASPTGGCVYDGRSMAMCLFCFEPDEPK